MRRLTATVLDTPEPRRLARFYTDLLGWEVLADESDWVTVRDPRAPGAGLSFQREPLYRAPAWPAEPTGELMQMHLDVEVDDLSSAVHEAERLGARIEQHQPQDDVRVMRDPDGHLFCLWMADDT